MKTKNELKYYLREDSRNYKDYFSFSFHSLLVRLSSHPSSDQCEIWNYIKTMRYVEFYGEKKGFISEIVFIYYLRKLRRISYKTGFQIPPFVFGPGLTIWHWGPIVINAQARVGKNCVLHPDITIGQNSSQGNSPKIGDDVTICSGARILGEIRIGNDVIVGVNTIITKDIPPHSVVVGAPAKIIKTRKSMNDNWEKTNIIL